MANHTIYNPGPQPKFKATSKKPKLKYKKVIVQGHVTNHRKEINWHMIERMAHVGTTPQEMAYILEISEPTLRQYEEFLSVYRRSYCVGNASLRRRQWRRAMEGSDTMLKWLGIQRLGQKDALQLSGDPLNPLEVQVTNIDLNRLNVEQLRQLEALYAEAEVPAGEQIIDVQDASNEQALALTPVVKVNGRTNGKSK